MRRRRLGRFNFWTGVICAIAILCLVFIIYPFGRMFLQSFFDKTGALTLDNYIRFFTKRYYRNALLNSVKICFTCTILSVALGVPMAYISTRYNIWCKRLINIMVIISLMSPPFIGAYSWITLLGRNGFLTKLLQAVGIHFGSIYGFGGIVLVFVLKLYPFVYMYVRGALSSMDASLDEASENLGVSGLPKLFKVTFPLILPTLTSSALMVFMNALADFGTPLLIGEGYKVLPVVIYEEYLSEVATNASFASALSVIIVACSLLVLMLQRRVVKNRNFAMSALRPPAVKVLPAPARVLLTSACFLVAFLGILPQVTVMVTSFLATNGPMFTAGFSLNSYQKVFSNFLPNILNSYRNALVALVLMVAIAVLLSYLIVRQRSRFGPLLDSLVMFPYVIPGSVVGIALLSAFNRRPIVLVGTSTIIVIALVMRRLQYTLKSSTSILYQIDGSVDEASISLGVSPMKTFWKITFQIMLPGVLSGAVLSLVSCINELSASLMLYSGKTATISVGIFTEIMHDSYGSGAALATILTVTTIISLVIFDKISGGKSVI